MSRRVRRDTGPEVAIRKALYRLGLRYRVHYTVPGRSRRSIDIAFPGRKVAVFVDGCFWHGCPEHGTKPTSNESWWATKLQRNRERDDDTDQALIERGWNVVRVWEHEPVDDVVARLSCCLVDRGQPGRDGLQ